MVGSAHLSLAYEAKLKSAADERVIFTGPVFGEPLTDLWNGAHAVIHPSITEGMSLSLLEAMAHRKCVIVSDIPENLEVIGDGALTFRAGDADDLARILGRVDNDPELIAEFGKKALARVKEEYDWQNIVTRLEEVYRGQ